MWAAMFGAAAASDWRLPVRPKSSGRSAAHVVHWVNERIVSHRPRENKGVPMAQSMRENAVVSSGPSQPDGARLAQCLPSLRRQIAVARTLLDELEESVPSSSALLATSAQVIEELKRLGTRVLDAAAVLEEHQDADREEPKRG
jgi:hypothetical protein